MNIDLKKGDTILGGKFKNKKYVVDDFEEDENNQPIIKTKNKKKLKALTFRIDKLMPNNKQKKNESKELSIRRLLNENLNNSKYDKYFREFSHYGKQIKDELKKDNREDDANKINKLLAEIFSIVYK